MLIPVAMLKRLSPHSCPLIGANLAYKDANMEHLYMVISYNIFVYLLKPFFFLNL